MRVTFFLILTTLMWIDCAAQKEKFETIEFQMDTLESLSKTGIVIRVSYKCSVEYHGKHDKEQLTRFCNDEIRHSIREEIINLQPNKVKAPKIESEIRPTLDSLFQTNNIKIRTLVIKRL